MKINPTTLLDLSGVIDVLAKAVAQSGTQAKWGLENEVSTAYVSDVLNGRREPGKKILDALGYEAVTGYRAKK